ncbi:MAG: hypothetical protein N4J56_006825 [Chroococcidiopsis sp. SAG 2025]|nr:hypothetical protein [Chroococcidiopsis sp. SAG 2025]
MALQLDTADIKTFDSFAAQVQQSLKDQWQADRFDLLVNNAGTGVHSSFAETTEEDFDRLMNIGSVAKIAASVVKYSLES